VEVAMIDYKYYEYEGMDPGLGVYDGGDYLQDEFGERIGDDFYEEIGTEVLDDRQMAEDDEVANEAIEDGFRETINPDNPNLQDQIEDQKLHEEAKSDYDADADAT